MRPTPTGWQYGRYVSEEATLQGGFLPVFWDVPKSTMHAVSDVGALVEWLQVSVAIWLKLPSRLKSLCRTANGAKAPSSLVHTGTGPARLQVGWLSCLVFAFFFLSSVVWTHWSTFSL